MSIIYDYKPRPPEDPKRGNERLERLDYICKVNMESNAQGFSALKIYFFMRSML